MRISLKWFLVAVAYGPLAILACVQPGEGWKTLLWYFNVGIVLLTLLIAFNVRGRTQMLALGFALFAASYGIACYVFPERIPVLHVVREFAPNSFITEEERAALEQRLVSLEWERTISVGGNANQDYQSDVQQRYDDLNHRLDTAVTLESLRESVDAIVMLLLGLAGAAIGALVWKSGQRVATAENKRSED